MKERQDPAVSSLLDHHYRFHTHYNSYCRVEPVPVRHTVSDRRHCAKAAKPVRMRKRTDRVPGAVPGTGPALLSDSHTPHSGHQQNGWVVRYGGSFINSAAHFNRYALRTPCRRKAGVVGGVDRKLKNQRERKIPQRHLAAPPETLSVS